MKNGHVERIAKQLSHTELLYGRCFNGVHIEDSDAGDRIISEDLMLYQCGLD
jgi:hypothetical protein